MDATTGAALQALARVAGRAIGKVLANPVRRAAVAWKASRRAQDLNISVSAVAIFRWLSRRDVRSHLDAQDPHLVDSALTNLAWRIAGRSVEHAGQVLVLVVEEYRKALSTREAIDVNANRILNKADDVQAAVDRIPARVREQHAQVAYDISLLNPARQARTRALADRWPPAEDLLHSLVSATDRGEQLASWGSTAPAQMADAPAEAWVWLGELAHDYGRGDVGITFIRTGIAHGIPGASYWWARAALMLNQEGNEAQMRELIANGKPPHPLSSGLEHVLNGDYAAAESVLAAWPATEVTDVMLRAYLRSVAAVGIGRFSAAIEFLEAAVTANPEAAGLRVQVAEMLLSRARFAKSTSMLVDYDTARRHALAARDSRRRWDGDSVAAILTAVKATALLGDFGQAQALVTAAPEGEATLREASDKRLVAEKAMLAALSDDEETAVELIPQIDRPFDKAMVQGWLAHRNGDTQAAARHWLTAWDEASTDMDRIQAASSLAPLGGDLPDLTEVEAMHPDSVAAIRAIHDVMSTPGDRLPVLRARAPESEQLTVLLAEHLVEIGQEADAAEVFRAGAMRWKHPLMMRMAARHLLSIGEHRKAADACESALRLAGEGWAGTLDTLQIQFEAEEALGLHELSLLTARRMVALAPENLSVRWLLIECLVREGSLEEAWSALEYRGEPLPPRTAQEARVWIGLCAKYDTSDQFLRRALDLYREWADNPDLQGVILLQLHGRSVSLELTDEEVAELQAATNVYVAENPDSRVLRAVPTGPEEDPLRGLADVLRESAPPPELVELIARIGRGEMPIGAASSVTGRSYTECALIRAGGTVQSDNPNLQGAGADAVRRARSAPALVIDPTAAVTLATLGDSTSQALVGSFAFLDTTAEMYRDALDARDSVALGGGMTIRWDEEGQRIVASTQSAEDAALLQERAGRVVQLLGKTRRRSWPKLLHFPKKARKMRWLSALDYAIEIGAPFWSDDVIMRQLAVELGVPAFGTRDLLMYMLDEGLVSAAFVEAAEAALIGAFHVDFGFAPGVMRLAASLDGWRPAGAAVNLTRPAAWDDPDLVLAFLFEATDANASTNPDGVSTWVAAASLGVIRLAPGSILLAQANLERLLLEALSHHISQPELVPFIVEGVRSAMTEAEGLRDPLEAALRQIHAGFVGRLGHVAASERIQRLVAHCNEPDQLLAIGVVLTTRP